MIAVDQRHPADPERPDGLSADGRQGDCLVCCIASVTEVPYDEIPHFAEYGPAWWERWRMWARERLGLDVATLVPVEGRIEQFVDGDPAEMTIIACGPSPRRRDGDGRTRHAVVVDGHLALLHDPHPSRAGLPSVDELYLFVPIREQPAREAAGG